MNAADVDGDGTIDYQEFLGATIHLSKLNKEEYLMKAFKHFDADNSGFITRSELIEGLKGMGSTDLEKIIDEVDKDNDGNINYEEFCIMMREQSDDVPGIVPTGL